MTIQKARYALSFFLIFFLSGVSADAGVDWNKIGNEAEKVYKEYKQGGPLSNGDVVGGLKEALTVGSRNAAGLASRVDGFYKNPRIFIPFPPEALKVKSTLEGLGLKSQVDRFVMTLNRAAEEAAKEAAPIFVNAVRGLTIQDGFKILNGPNNAATSYLRGKTTAQLTAAFRPVVQRAIQKTEVTKYWSPLASDYNRLPMVQKVNPDLNAYVTQKAVSGLFQLIANEELKIRRDPAARVTDLLKKVFGAARP